MSSLFVCNKIDSLKAKECVELKDLNLTSMTVHSLSSIIADKLGTHYSPDEPSFELICFGKQLKGEKLLSSYGIRNGTTVFVFKRIVDEEKRFEDIVDKGKRPKLDQTEIDRMVVALRTALVIPSFRNLLDKLYEKEFRENLIACTPGLRNDPIALAILQNPNLLALLTETDNIQRVLEKHPSIPEAATYLAAAFHEAAISTPTTSTTENASGSGLFGLPTNSYSLDDLSDDEDDLGGGVDAAPPDGQQVMSPRTAHTFQQLMQQTRGSNSGGASSSNHLQGVITTEMLRQAIEASQPSTSGVSNDSAMQSANQARDWSQQIRQLNEVGITDNALIVHALEATNGDVQAAINIIFSDVNP